MLSLVGSEMCIRDRGWPACGLAALRSFKTELKASVEASSLALHA
jgi:hypothetical protein